MEENDNLNNGGFAEQNSAPSDSAGEGRPAQNTFSRDAAGAQNAYQHNYDRQGDAYMQNGAYQQDNGVYPPAYGQYGAQYGGYYQGNSGAYPSGGSAYPPEKRKKKKGIGWIVALCIVAGLVLGGAVGAFAPTFFENDVSTVPDDDPSQSVSTADPDETSVPKIVGIAPLPEGGYDSLAELYQKSVKSCVTIICDVQYNNGFFSGEGKSLGSGFIVEGVKNGEKRRYIVTNHHVIKDAKAIKAKYSDGRIFEAALVGSDELSDIAVLTTDREDVTPIELGDSSQLQVGQWVAAIGTPSNEELQNTMSYGIVSGVNRELPITNDYGMVIKTMTVIQTTATLNPGNSGGPLINMAGQVVGINAMKLAEEYEGIGFALPSTEASNIINSLIEYGKVTDPSSGFVSGAAQLGIKGTTVTDEVRKAYELGDDCPDGVLVVSINRGTAVYKAGLSVYDIITEFDGKAVKTIEELKERISEKQAGDEVTLTYCRIDRFGKNSGDKTVKFKLDSAH